MLARVESNQSLQSYAVLAPIAGVVIERHVTVGDVTGDAPLYRIGDTGRLVADFPVFGRDMGRVRPGQPVEITPANGGGTVQATIAALVPMADASSQAIMARAPLPTADATRLPGMAVRGRVIVEETEAPLAVRTSAIQRFRDFEVVYAKVGETYEVRMLDIGRRTPEWTEVLGGLEAGEEYVTANSYLIKADIEKSGASHDH
jgi:membrane fusion protein, heavy metal efflux system